MRDVHVKTSASLRSAGLEDHLMPSSFTKLGYRVDPLLLLSEAEFLNTSSVEMKGGVSFLMSPGKLVLRRHRDQSKEARRSSFSFVYKSNVWTVCQNLNIVTT